MSKKNVTNTKMLTLVALLSNYDLFHIIEKDGKCDFYATKITEYHDFFLMFHRLFAAPIFSLEPLIDIVAANEQTFVCKTENLTYTIHALHMKPDEIAAHKDRQYKDIDDLMCQSFFGSRFNTYIKQLDRMILVVDPYLLGELTAKEAAQIKRIINVNLSGLSRSMQMCRTICFEVQLHSGRDEIYAGIYDLEHNVPVTSTLLYEERMKDFVSDEFYTKCHDVIRYAQEVYHSKNFSEK